MGKRLIFYDTETTGTRIGSDKIIELAAFDPERNLTFSRLINPKIPIPEEATSIHNITDEMVKDAPTFDVVAAEFLSFCEGDAVLIAHNNDAFDFPFLKEEFKNHSLPFPNLQSIDSLKWARKYRKDLPRHALQFLREIYGIEKNQAHRALDDVYVLHQVFTFLTGDLTVETILHLLEQKDEIVRMPFGKHQGKFLKDIPKDYVTWLASSGAFDKKENDELKLAFQKLGFLQEAVS